MGPLPAVDGVTHRWVTARGLRWHVAEAGSGGDVVVLLHGFPQHWYEWRRLMPTLARRYRVIAVDLPGSGWSDAPRMSYRKEQLADHVLGLLDALGLARVNLVGHDWGGWIGFLLCLRAPERIRRFLALNIIHPWPGPTSLRSAWRLWYQLILAAPVVGYAAQRTRWFTRLLLRLGTADGKIWDPAVLAAFADVQAEPSRARAGVRLYRTFLLRELIPILRGRFADARLTVPSRLLFGCADATMDPAMLATNRGRAAEIPVELVPGCGHFIAEECPDLVADRALALFAEDIPEPGASHGSRSGG